MKTDFLLYRLIRRLWPRCHNQPVVGHYLTQHDLTIVGYRSILNELKLILRSLNLKTCGYGKKSGKSYTIHFSRDWEWPWAIMQSEVRKGDVVLDVGCGCTPFLPYLARYGCKCYGIDPNPDYDIKTHGLDRVTNDFFSYVKNIMGLTIRFRKEGMEKMSFADNFFDVVYCISVLEHVDSSNTCAGLKEMVRVLKPKGKLVITIDVDGGHVENRDILKELLNIPGTRIWGNVSLAMPVPKEAGGTYHVFGIVLVKNS
jgi:SAM-dependent methyltransferase